MQAVDQLIDVATWAGDEDFEKMYPEGSRVKSLLRCPHPAPFDFLIPGHRYLFKQSFQRYPDQYWMEVLAHRVGSLIGVEVPPAFVAFNGRTGTCAALIEWFYGKPGTPPCRYVRGGEVMKRLIPGYDIKRGEQHNFQAIKATCMGFSKPWAMPDWRPHWAKVFLFDALIANTDRHQDNWGVVLETRPRGKRTGYWSPAFDNGTSMGYNYFEDRLKAMGSDLSQMAVYMRRGTHHAKWKKDGPRLQHGDFLVRYCGEYPETKALMLGCLNFSDDALSQVVLPLTGLQTAVPLTRVRAEFVVKLLTYRRDQLRMQLAAIP